MSKRALTKATGDETHDDQDDPTARRTVTARKDLDHLLIPALVAGLSYENAADRAGCSKSTVERRLADPEFHMRLVEAKNDVLDRLLGSSINGALVATNYLVQVVIGQEEGVTHTHRIRAAVALRSGLDRLDSHIAGSVP